ncbi:hypothetical protein PoB_003845600 [Plakobranchus ocellatus]|uniref:Uncharacterized protein n=1 Tax=Plakobranchus ocellatus TaxID=259542 RepID=A0AAV4AL98_9GAST|nr:hypothetical protein PoB_003845600 [Plakobranchus ocellatus]
MTLGATSYKIQQAPQESLQQEVSVWDSQGREPIPITLGKTNSTRTKSVTYLNNSKAHRLLPPALQASTLGYIASWFLNISKPSLFHTQHLMIARCLDLHSAYHCPGVTRQSDSHARQTLVSDWRSPETL